MPTRADAPTLDRWIARCLAADEPLWHRTYAKRTTTLTVASAWSGLGKLAAQVEQAGALKIVAKTAAVIALDSLLPRGETSVDLFFRGSATQEPVGVLVALTPVRLFLLAVGQDLQSSTQPRDVPLWQASWTPEQVASAPLRLRSSRFLMAESIDLSLGEEPVVETFRVQRAPNNPPVVFEDEYAQAEAIRARLERVLPLTR